MRKLSYEGKLSLNLFNRTLHQGLPEVREVSFSHEGEVYLNPKGFDELADDAKHPLVNDVYYCGNALFKIVLDTELQDGKINVDIRKK